MAEAKKAKKEKHFVLVHGVCGGAWVWYKLKPLLEAAGHRVTALDLAASGIHKKALEDVHTFSEYAEPLLEFMTSLQGDEKVILVGHSLGGMSLALAMDKFPDKVSLAVFVSAILPDTAHQPSYALEQFSQSSPKDLWLDSQFSTYGSNEEPKISVILGPKFLASNCYQLSPIEDLELAKVLLRPGSQFLEDLSKANKFSNEGFGSVARAYVVCKEDCLVSEKFQRWMIENSKVAEVVEIDGADHMPMASKPQQLCQCLLEMACKYD